jgi:hypothetical protein
MTGTGPIVAVRDTLYGERASSIFSWNCDSVPVGAQTFDQVRAYLEGHDMLWKTSTREGVVFMTPPHAGTMGVAVFAKSFRRRDALRDAVIGMLRPRQ